MRLDQFNNPIYNSVDVFNLLYQGKGDCLTEIFVDADSDLKKFEHVTNILLNDVPAELSSIAEFDKHQQQQWFMPDNYCPNLVEDLYKLCKTQEQIDRVNEEMEAFIERGLMDLLFFLKYLVDKLQENNIVWGVGRGSSVASYVLFLMGVHHIDSMKYNLDWREFLR